jgi:hypothetical protein
MPRFLAQRLANKAGSNAAKIKRWVSGLSWRLAKTLL